MHPRVQWTLGYLRRVLLDLCELVPIGTWTVSDSHFNKFRFSVCLSLSLSLSPRLSPDVSLAPQSLRQRPLSLALQGSILIGEDWSQHGFGADISVLDLWRRRNGVFWWWSYVWLTLPWLYIWSRGECVKGSYANRVELWQWGRGNELHLEYWCSPWHSLEFCAHEFPMIGVACIMHSFGSFVCFYKSLLSVCQIIWVVKDLCCEGMFNSSWWLCIGFCGESLGCYHIC